MKKFNFHDAFIDNISYEGNTLNLHVNSVVQQEKGIDYVIKTKSEEYDIRFCYLKRYPRLNKVKFKLKELDIKHVKALLLRKKRMQIIDAFYATYQNKFILECDVFPCSQKRGCSDKIYLEISNFDDFNIVTDSEKTE